MLFPWEALRALCLAGHLGICLPDLVVTWLPAWLEGRLLPAWEGLSPAGVFVVASLPAWEEVLSLGMGGTVWVVAAKLLPSLGGGEHLPGNELPGKLLNCFLFLREGEHLPACLPEMPLNCFLPWEEGECLPAWEETKFWEELNEVTLVIFPSFLFSKLLNLFSCLCLTLLNLILLTFSTKPWQSLSLCVDKMDANCDLHSSVCLLMLSRILFIALILAWSKSFSAFLSLFLALSVFKVDFSLILTGIKSLCMHFKLKILWFL